MGLVKALNKMIPKRLYGLYLITLKAMGLP